MKGLPKPTVTPMDVTTPHGENFHQYSFDLKKKFQKKDVDKAVLDFVEQTVQKQGSVQMNVLYWLDKPYASDVIEINSLKDVKKFTFDSDFMTDYDDETGIMNDNTLIQYVSMAIASNEVDVGEDCHNDCFYHALRRCFRVKPPLLASAEHFKKSLGLNRDEKVPLSLIPRIEKQCEICIFTSGSYNYESMSVFPRSAKFYVKDDHIVRLYSMDHHSLMKNGYSPIVTHKSPCCESSPKKHVKPVRKYPIFYKRGYDNDTVLICYYSKGKTGDKVIDTKPMSWLGEFYKTNRMRFKYFLKAVDAVKKDGKSVIPDPHNVIDTQIELMIEFQKKSFEILGKCATGNLNPFRSHFRLRPMASHYFYTHAPQCLWGCDDFIDYEEEWLAKAMTGGILFSQRAKLKKCVEHDKNSFYPSLMKKVDFITRKGVFKTIEDIDIRNEYCIVRCEISDYDERIFQKNKNNFYTGFDILTAQQFGFTIKLVRDGKPNCLEYDENCRVSGREIFGKFVNDLYKLKSNTTGEVQKIAKGVLSCLWGYLFKKSLYTKNTKEGTIHLKSFSELKTIIPSSFKSTKNQRVILKHSDSILQFKYGRFAPFLTALGRRTMALDMADHVDKIFRVHTDGFIAKTKIRSFKISDRLGHYKLKKGSCNIKNVNKTNFVEA